MNVKFPAILLGVFIFCLCTSFFKAGAQKRQYIQLRIYHTKDSVQLKQVSQYLEEAYLPALHKAGYKMVGVFTNITNDTAIDKKVYVLIPLNSLKNIDKLSLHLENDMELNNRGKDYLQASHNNAPYIRFETILLKSFQLMPRVVKTQLTGDIKDRIYELRSYESPTEMYFKSKVKMFNQGGEISLFKRLGFNAVFYSEVVFGSHMPNLMYMTSFDNMAAREAHWKSFGNDPEWKKLSALPEYQDNVSHINIEFLHATAYSDL
jgi:hypothetical protein